MDDGSAGWVVGGIGTVIGTLGSAVAVLFKLNESKNTEAIVELNERLNHAEDKFTESDKKHEDCLRDREALRIEMAVVRERLQSLQKTTDKIDRQTEGD